MTRVLLPIGLVMMLSCAALAQDVIRIPLQVEPEEAETEGGDTSPSTAPEDTSPAETEDVVDDEELMDRFMRPLNEQPVYDPEAGGAGGLPPPVPDRDGIARVATLRGLDKITARVTDIEAPVGVPVMFNSFEILVQTCYKRPPEETPEVTAFLQITEHRLDGTLARIFSGWMYASTPSLNPVEHPVYDVWLIDCRAL